MLNPQTMSRPALPLKLWVDILLQLGYFQSCRVGRLNRSFREIMSHPYLAASAFKGTPSAASRVKELLKRDDGPTVHPLLDGVG